MKKGIADTNKQLFWTLFIIPSIIIIIGIIVFVVPRIIEAKTTIHPDLQEYIYIDRLTRSDACFAYEKDGFVYANYIDINKFEKNRLSCLDENRDFSLLLVLHYEKDGLNSIELTSEDFRISKSKVVYYEPVIVVDNEIKKGTFLEIQLHKKN